MMQRILIGLDGSPLAESVLPLVGALCRSSDPEVLLLRVVDIQLEARERWSDQPEILARVATRLRGEADQYLSGLGRWLTLSRLRGRPIVAQGDPAEEIVRVAEREDADIIAMTTHGSSGLFTSIYGTVAERVLYSAGRPLLLMRPRSEGQRAAVAISQIMVPLDGSRLSETALPMAEDVARGLDVPLVAVRVAERVQAVLAPDAHDELDVRERVLPDEWEDVEHYLRAITDSARERGVRASAVAPSGFPSTAIVDYANDHPNCLLVMATRGRTGVEGALVGSVARQIIQHISAPVLLLPPRLSPVR